PTAPRMRSRVVTATSVLVVSRSPCKQPDSEGCGSSGGTGTVRTEAGKSPVTTGLSGRSRSLCRRRSESIPAAAQAPSRQVWTRPRLQTGQNAGQPRPLPPGSPATPGILPHSRRAAPTLDSVGRRAKRSSRGRELDRGALLDAAWERFPDALDALQTTGPQLN